MHYTPRTIAFHCELLHPAWVPDAALVQRVHNQLFQDGEPLYRSFDVRHDGVALGNPAPGPGVVSQAAFMADRVRFVEESTGLTVDEFGARVRRLAELSLAERPLPLFTGQVVTVRTLVNPRHHGGGVAFLKDGILRPGDALDEFGRPAQGLGLRFTFAPQPGEPNAFGVRVESVPRDPRSLFVEIQGTFPPIPLQGNIVQASGEPLPIAPGLEVLSNNVHATYNFATERVLRFLARFDQPEEPS